MITQGEFFYFHTKIEQPKILFRWQNTFASSIATATKFNFLTYIIKSLAHYSLMLNYHCFGTKEPQPTMPLGQL